MSYTVNERAADVLALFSDFELSTDAYLEAKELLDGLTEVLESDTTERDKLDAIDDIFIQLHDLIYENDALIDDGGFY